MLRPSRSNRHTTRMSPLRERFQALRESRSLGLGPRHFVHEDRALRDAVPSEGVNLETEVLAVGTHPSIPEGPRWGQ